MVETERSADTLEELVKAIEEQQPEHNILIDALPETVKVFGREFAIDSGFRAMVLFELAMNDPEIDKSEAAATALYNFYLGNIPGSIDAATAALIWFYRCGYECKPTRKRSNKDTTEIAEPQKERVFDYELDAPLIYSAFRRQYGIDLQDIEHLHWWKFRALFDGLPEDENIVKIIGYRSIELSQIKDKEQRRRYARLKARYRLPDTRSVEEKIAAAGAAFGRMAKK